MSLEETLRKRADGDGPVTLQASQLRLLLDKLDMARAEIELCKAETILDCVVAGTVTVLDQRVQDRLVYLVGARADWIFGMSMTEMARKYLAETSDT